MNTSDFNNWLDTAAIGDKLVYHSTDYSLATDRSGSRALKRLAVPGLDELASLALDAEAAGRVALFQRRRPERGFDYLAVRVSRAYRYHEAPPVIRRAA